MKKVIMSILCIMLVFTLMPLGTWTEAAYAAEEMYAVYTGEISALSASTLTPARADGVRESYFSGSHGEGGWDTECGNDEWVMLAYKDGSSYKRITGEISVTAKEGPSDGLEVRHERGNAGYCDENGEWIEINRDTDLYTISCKKSGIYTLTDSTGHSMDIKVRYPQTAFFTTDTPSEETLIGNNLNFVPENGEMSLYLIIQDYKDWEGGNFGAPVIRSEDFINENRLDSSGFNPNDYYTLTEVSSPDERNKVYKVTVKEALMYLDFRSLRVSIKMPGGWEWNRQINLEDPMEYHNSDFVEEPTMVCFWPNDMSWTDGKTATLVEDNWANTSFVKTYRGSSGMRVSPVDMQTSIFAIRTGDAKTRTYSYKLISGDISIVPCDGTAETVYIEKEHRDSYWSNEKSKEIFVDGGFTAYNYSMDHSGQYAVSDSEGHRMVIGVEVDDFAFFSSMDFSEDTYINNVVFPMEGTSATAYLVMRDGWQLERFAGLKINEQDFRERNNLPSSSKMSDYVSFKDITPSGADYRIWEFTFKDTLMSIPDRGFEVQYFNTEDDGSRSRWINVISPYDDMGQFDTTPQVVAVYDSDIAWTDGKMLTVKNDNWVLTSFASFFGETFGITTSPGIESRFVAALRIGDSETKTYSYQIIDNLTMADLPSGVKAEIRHETKSELMDDEKGEWITCPEYPVQVINFSRCGEYTLKDSEGNNFKIGVVLPETGFYSAPERTEANFLNELLFDSPVGEIKECYIIVNKKQNTKVRDFRLNTERFLRENNLPDNFNMNNIAAFSLYSSNENQNVYKVAINSTVSNFRQNCLEFITEFSEDWGSWEHYTNLYCHGGNSELEGKTGLYIAVNGNEGMEITPNSEGIYEIPVVTTSEGAIVLLNNGEPVPFEVTPEDGDFHVGHDSAFAEFNASFLFDNGEFTGEEKVFNLKFRTEEVKIVFTDALKGAGSQVKAKVLTKVQNLKASLTKYNSVKISWTKQEIADGYRVYAKKGTGSYALLKTTTANSYTAADLSKGVKYTFKVVPYVKDGSSKLSGPLATVTSTTLKKVSSVKAAKSGTKVKVSWSNIAGESGYQISKSTSKTKTSIVKTVASTSATYSTVTATKGKTYYYKVRAYKTVNGKKVYGPWSTAVAYTRK